MKKKEKRNKKKWSKKKENPGDKKWYMEWINIDFESQEVISRKSMIKEQLTTFNFKCGSVSESQFRKIKINFINWYDYFIDITWSSQTVI